MTEAEMYKRADEMLREGIEHILDTKHDYTDAMNTLFRLAKKHDAWIEKEKISGSGETGKPQATKTNADEKTCAVLETIETEGRVSGGNRASFGTNGSDVAK